MLVKDLKEFHNPRAIQVFLVTNAIQVLHVLRSVCCWTIPDTTNKKIECLRKNRFKARARVHYEGKNYKGQNCSRKTFW